MEVPDQDCGEGAGEVFGGLAKLLNYLGSGLVFHLGIALGDGPRTMSKDGRNDRFRVGGLDFAKWIARFVLQAARNICTGVNVGEVCRC